LVEQELDVGRDVVGDQDQRSIRGWRAVFHGRFTAERQYQS
jgi:hypothetical protein